MQFLNIPLVPKHGHIQRSCHFVDVTSQSNYTCAGTILPSSERLIRKSTRLLVNSEEMQQLAKTCPGPADPKHVTHDVVKGSAPGVPQVSTFAAAYTTEFVHAVLHTIPKFADLVGILRHGHASEQALRLAKEFSCEFCRSQQKPSVPLPRQPRRVSKFNHAIGIDVKKLPGWRPNQKICALKIDQASSFQRMVPFFEQQTSKLLRHLLQEHSISWTGAPK